MLNVESARRLLDLGRRMGNPARAHDQLEGVVAMHNILEQHGVAYLADEVGMGKTYVALGVVALLRHYQPDLRVLVIAPRANIQAKWQREQRVFTRHNLRIDDLRTRMPGGLPARPLVSCDGLLDLVYEASNDPDRDFFVRLPSFSLPMRKDAEQRRRFRDRLLNELPWLPESLLDLRGNTDRLKETVAQVINTALPRFDLVVVDEAHNLKHGRGPSASSRNRVLATVLGRTDADVPAPLRPSYGPRVGRLMLISATPVDDDYRQLWNQLDVFDRAGPFDTLRNRDATVEEKRATVARFLIRRVTSLRIDDKPYTKNLYRREWRAGGLLEHDQPIRISDDRQRLAVALVQKKVSELLGHERFGSRFQIGMLASFESFLQTTNVSLDAQDDEDGPSAFDETGQTTDPVERQGADVPMLNGLAAAYRRRFGTDLPHPKMDALVAALAPAWQRGEKGLVFVRRIASVTELKLKLDHAYDEWLIERLRTRIASRHAASLTKAVERYRRRPSRHSALGEAASDADDAGGDDSFFAWYFRGRGPTGTVSGATIQERFRNRGGPLGTFFDDNHVMALLGAKPGEVVSALADALGLPVEALREKLRERSRCYLSEARQPTRGARFDAVQAAALQLLAETPGRHQPAARIIWRELYQITERSTPVTAVAEPDLLEVTTFFTQLRLRPRLRDAIWPTPDADADLDAAFREQYLRAQLLSAAARLGHPFPDLYAVITDHLPSLDAAAVLDPTGDVVADYLDELERQQQRTGRDWAAYDELAELSGNYDLVLDTCAPEARQLPLLEVPALVGRLFSAQQPVGGMAGQVNRRMVQQFRLPGYPFVLICTDLLQEGEDLHTFCSRVYHYGLAWTPSAAEQRIGPIDRVSSQTERRLTAQHAGPVGEELLQVFYPHLADTVERLQVRRVLRRMADFTRLMHEELITAQNAAGHVDISREILDEDDIPVLTEPLTTAFPVRDEHLAGDDRPLAVDEATARHQIERFQALRRATLASVPVDWAEDQPGPQVLLGTARLPTGRHQPFSLQLGWLGGHLVVRAISPIGLVDRARVWTGLWESTCDLPIRVGVIEMRGEKTYDATVEEDVVLTEQVCDADRVGALVNRVARQADALEQRHLPGRDRLLEVFRKELERDVRHG